MAFIDALAALCLSCRDLADGQRHRRPAIWAGRSAEPPTPIFVAASTGLLHGAVELSRFGGRAAIVGGCDLRQRFVVYARAGKARARRLGLAPRPRGSRRARPRSCQSSKLTHAVLSQQWRGERVEQT